MRLSPFPPDVKRPWRDVAVYAGHGIAENMGSWWWWLRTLGFPLLLMVALVGATVASLMVRPQTLAVVAEDPAILETATATMDMWQGTPIVLLGEAPEQRRMFAGVLHLEGTLPNALAPRLVLVDPEQRRQLSELSNRFVRGVHVQALVPQAEIDLRLARNDQPEQAREQDAAVLVSRAAPAVVAVLTLVGVMGGGGAGSSLTRAREEGLWVVLRIGTSSEVLFLGGLLERAVLGAVRFLPWAAVFIVPLILVAFAGGLLGGGQFTGLLVLSVVLMMVGYLVGAGFGVLAGGSQQAGGAFNTLPILAGALGLIPFLRLVSEAEGVALALAGVVPVFGAPFLAKAAFAGVIVAPIAGLGAQVVAGLVALRLGAWAYGLEESVWANLSRRWRRRAS